MNKRIDLHIHTNISDGELSPKEVVDEAAKNGVNTISIADHDIIEAYNDELYNYAKSKNIKIINGVEISAKTNKAGIHVLGYNFDINNKEFKERLFLLRNGRHKYLYDVEKKLNELGYILNIEELDKIEAVTKAHIALDIINNQKNTEILLKNFNHIPTKGEFIEAIMIEGCPAYVEKETISPKEAAELIRKAGGKVVLAHPIAYKYEDDLRDEDILKIINEMKADGIEANYIYIERNGNKINETKKWNDFAKKNDLIVTIGSDFHKKDGIHPEIGLVNENLNLDNFEVENIINNITIHKN